MTVTKTISKRKQFLILLLLFSLLLPLLPNRIKEISLALLLSRSGLTTEGSVSDTWIESWSFWDRREKHYVDYEFDLNEKTYRAIRWTTDAVFKQAKDTHRVKVYYLPTFPSVNSPLFWGKSAIGFMMTTIWGVLLVAAICTVSALWV
ncbi:hypothetical protein JW935_02650 [candidate division KSB1 bacterium]|nr:hypothetical protein [candidate division KSB1 bacterium]